MTVPVHRWRFRTLSPGSIITPLLLFLFYYAIYDFVYYWMHRTQHALPWWWALHSMHHSQRQMSCWTNDRGNLIDGFIQSMVLAVVGLLIGVQPDEFAWLMLLGEAGAEFFAYQCPYRFWTRI